MGNGLLAFAAGLGSGYLTAKQRGLDQQALEEERAMRRVAFENQQDEVTRLKRDRASLADAGKLATVNPDGAVLSLADGTQTAYGDAGAANSDFRQFRSADAATGNQTLATTPIPAVPATPDQPASLADGTMPQAPQSAPVVNNKAYGTLADANTAAATLNAPEAIVARQAAALNAMGQPEKAAALVAGAKQAKLTDYQLSTAQTNHLNELANQKITDRAAANGGDWFKTQADILTETGVGGLAGTKAAPKLSADGKTVQIVLTRPDGTEKVLRQYGNDDRGQMRAQQDLMQVNPTVKMQWLHERATTDQAQKNFDRTHSESERHNKATEDSKAATDANRLEIAGLRLSHQQSLADSKKGVDRMSEADKMTLANINKQRDVIHAAIVKATAEGQWDPNSAGAKNLTLQQFSLDQKQRDLYAKYESSKPTPDPAMVKGDAATPKKAASINPPSPPPKKSGSEAPSLANTITSAPKEQTPNYEAWLKAKEQKDEIVSAAAKMSAERRDLYLSNRLPEIEKQIEFHKNYRTY